MNDEVSHLGCMARRLDLVGEFISQAVQELNLRKQPTSGLRPTSARRASVSKLS
jgi:hypothetical protein